MIQRVREQLRRRLGSFIASDLDGNFLLDRQSPTELRLSRVILAIDGWVWGVIPVFRLRRIKSIGFTEAVSHSREASLATLAAELQETPGAVGHAACEELGEVIRARLDRVRGNANVQIKSSLDRFEGKYLRNLIRSDRNKFRQILLEAIAARAQESFMELARGRVAELVMRVREEAVNESGSYDKAGPLALPSGTRFVVRKGKMTVFVTEHAPHARTLKIMEDNKERADLFKLSFPFIVFFVVMRGRKVERMFSFFRQAPLRSQKDQLLCPALPNIMADFGVCFAASATKDSLAETAEESIASFWGGRFVRTHNPANLTQQIALERWQSETARNGLFGLEYEWRPAQITVEGMLAEIDRKFAADTAKRKPREPGQLMSRLEAVTESVAQSMGVALKEICFELASNWPVDETGLRTAETDFREEISRLSETIRTDFLRESEGVLTASSLTEIFRVSVERALHEIQSGSSEAARTACDALISHLDEEDAE